ncbi:MAG TPA: hypothetical protein VMV47_08475 [Bacteroidales bacterium]|nr:hypothetical protein [Bacteroidales bacterium]
MKMKKKRRTTFRNVHSLEDIQKLKLRLDKRLKVTEKSISEKTDIASLLFSTKKIQSGLSDEEVEKLGIAGYLLPLGIKYVIGQMQKKPNSKFIKRLLIYSALASVSAYMVYQFIDKRKNKTSH